MGHSLRLFTQTDARNICFVCHQQQTLGMLALDDANPFRGCRLKRPHDHRQIVLPSEIVTRVRRKPCIGLRMGVRHPDG